MFITASNNLNLFSYPLNMLERFILQCVYFKLAVFFRRCHWSIVNFICSLIMTLVSLPSGGVLCAKQLGSTTKGSCFYHYIVCFIHRVITDSKCVVSQKSLFAGFLICCLSPSSGNQVSASIFTQNINHGHLGTKVTL